MSVQMARGSTFLVAALTFGAIMPLGASAFAADSVTVHVGTDDTVDCVARIDALRGRTR